MARLEMTVTLCSEATVASTDFVSAGEAQREQGKSMSGRKRARGSWLDRYSALLVAAALIAAWQILVPLSGISEFVLPTPLAIAKRIVKDLPLLSTHIYVTLFEVIFGFATGVLVGIPLALRFSIPRPSSAPSIRSW